MRGLGFGAFCILTLLIGLSWGQLCIPCKSVLQNNCRGCSPYCPAQAMQVLQQCTSLNCTSEQHCQQYETANSNSTTSQSVCQNLCCQAGNSESLDSRITRQCLRKLSGSQYTILVYVCSFGAAIVVGLVVGCLIYHKCYKKSSLQRRNYEDNPNLPQLDANLEASQNNLQRKQQEPFSSQPIDKMQICSICLEDNCNTTTRCRHIFHYGCFRRWWARHRQCPMCKSSDLSSVLLECPECNYMYIVIDLADVKWMQRQEQFLGRGILPRCNGCSKK